MRIHIFSDMEGVAGICKWDQVSAESPFYQEFRGLYTREINAAVRGARAAGATARTVALALLRDRRAQVIASDAHNAQTRRPELEHGFAAVTKELGAAFATALRNAPAEIVAGRIPRLPRL